MLKSHRMLYILHVELELHDAIMFCLDLICQSISILLTGETLLSPLVMCGPHGLKFKKPIELRLPHKGNSGDGMTFSLKSSDSPVGKNHFSIIKLLLLFTIITIITIISNRYGG